MAVIIKKTSGFKIKFEKKFSTENNQLKKITFALVAKCLIYTHTFDYLTLQYLIYDPL